MKIQNSIQLKGYQLSAKKSMEDWIFWPVNEIIYMRMEGPNFTMFTTLRAIVHQNKGETST